MPKLKVSLCVILSLCVFGLLVWGLTELGSRNSGQCKNPNPNPNLAETSESSLAPPSSKRPAQKDDPDRRISDFESITSCSVGMEILTSPQSTNQWIYPHGNGNSTKAEVLCDFEVDGGGWTVIQKRSSGPRDEFHKNWNEYSNGFGSLDRNFWLGLKNIHALTKNGDQELRVELEDFEGNKAWAKYSRFSNSDASDFYRLEISGFDGNSTAGDSMTNSEYSVNGNVNGMRFSTWDKDNDLWDHNCAERCDGGWWFNACGWISHLNGLYLRKGESLRTAVGIVWASWKGKSYSLAKTEMMIRKRKS